MGDADIEGMDIIDFAVAVMCGNLLTLSAAWGAHQLHKAEKETGSASNGSWLAFAMIAMPLMFFFAVALSSGMSHPSLDVIAQIK